MQVTGEGEEDRNAWIPYDRACAAAAVESVNGHSCAHKTEKQAVLSVKSKQGLLSWKEGRDFSGA